MFADIITIGDEILIGQVVDTNSAWIAQQLNFSGVRVRQILSISDDKEQILSALLQATQHSDIVIITGGLGPTKDDKTKPALCEFFNTELVFNQDSFNNTSRIFSERKLQMTEENKKQAMLPASCIPLPNKIGTAWGMLFEKENKIVVSLPGVPYEMRFLVENYVLPFIKEKFNTPNICHKTIITQGIGESWLAERIEEWESALPENINLAYLPSPGMVRLRLSAAGENKEALKNEIELYVTKLKSIIPEYICSTEDETLQQIVGKILANNNLTLSIAESCTGGFISHLITSVSGSSKYFMGSVVSYANEVKINDLGVKVEHLISKGAVSKEVVEQMAKGCREKFNTDYSIAVSGVAGPTGGSADKPVGTVWIAVASKAKVISHKYLFGDNRERNIQKAALTALNMLRKEILAIE
jgi:nicotinamide-nucleotide amidase